MPESRMNTVRSFFGSLDPRSLTGKLKKLGSFGRGRKMSQIPWQWDTKKKKKKGGGKGVGGRGMAVNHPTSQQEGLCQAKLSKFSRDGAHTCGCRWSRDKLSLGNPVRSLKSTRYVIPRGCLTTLCFDLSHVVGSCVSGCFPAMIFGWILKIPRDLQGGLRQVTHLFLFHLSEGNDIQHSSGWMAFLLTE